MPNIFDGIEKMSDVDLKNQIATLEEMTMTNALSPMGGMISNKTISIFGSIRKVIDGKETKVPEVVKIEDRIKNKYEALQNLNRDQLEERIREALICKINANAPRYEELCKIID